MIKGKHIVLVCNTAQSLFKFRGYIIKNLIADGYKVSCIAADDGESHHLTDLGAAFTAIPLSRSGMNPLREIYVVFLLLKELMRLKPDVVISYTIKPNSYVPLLARVLGVPCLAVVTGLGYAFIQGGLRAWLARTVLLVGLSCARRVWTLNRDDAEELIVRAPQLSSKISVAPGEGIDTDYFDDRLFPAKEGGRFTFMMIARLLKDKGVYEFAQAAQKVKAQYPDSCFQILGALDLENPAGLSAREFEKLCTDYPVTYLGVTSDVRKMIAESDVCVLPSYREGVPLALLEAASMRRVLIATDVAGCRDVVKDGVNGFLVSPRSSDLLAEAMCAVMALPSGDLYVMKEKARHDVCEGFAAQQITGLYRSILKDFLE